MKTLFLLLTVSLTLNAGTLSVVSDKYAFEEAPEYKAIMAQLAPYGEFSTKSEEVITPPVPKTLSKGEQAVEEAKARNRAILAEQNKVKENAPASELEEGPAKWRAETKKVQEGWKKEIKDQLKQWQTEQKIFEGKIKVYKANTFEIPAKFEKIVEKKVNVSALPDAHIVNGAFKIPVRDQSNRPTCSAFAGIRAVEILLAQNNQDKDLSEQYFYWASKPNCQKGPCTEKGSWINHGYRYSKEHRTIDIPLESNCAYKLVSDPQNETQVPLIPSCEQGATKVVNYEDVRTLSDVIERVKQNTPVVIAAKLSENYYRNQGLITLEDSKKTATGKMDSHALGHAMLAVGVIELPLKLKATEGNYCLVVVNSWGKGWGAGGYSCLTQNWLEKFRQPAAFVAVTKVSVN
jgi:C1A family cysteine protease